MVFRVYSQGPLGFYSSQVLLCGLHNVTGHPLQPFTTADREAGFGKQGCPFCCGGAFAGRFDQIRSRKVFEEMLASLEPNQNQA